MYLGLGGGAVGWCPGGILVWFFTYQFLFQITQWLLSGASIKKLPSSGLKNIFVKLEIVDVFFILFLLLRLSSAAAGGRGKGREGEKEEYNARVMGGVANCEVKNFLLSPSSLRRSAECCKEEGRRLFPFPPSFHLSFSQKFPGSINQCCFHCGGERRKVERREGREEENRADDFLLPFFLERLQKAPLSTPLPLYFSPTSVRRIFRFFLCCGRHFSPRFRSRLKEFAIEEKSGGTHFFYQGHLFRKGLWRRFLAFCV